MRGRLRDKPLKGMMIRPARLLPGLRRVGFPCPVAAIIMLRKSLAMKFGFPRLWRRQPASGLPAEIEQARALIEAVDRGGLPLNPAKVNAIARDLGLEVSRQALVEQTVERIRACLQR